MKITTLSLFTILGLGAINSGFAQTVSTTPENKNVVLEEYTGISCVWCPAGHKIANTLKQNNPDDVVLINVHTGGFATPTGPGTDFRTPFGSALAAQTGLTGYPSGTVNRHVFSGSNTALGRDEWTAKSNIILGQSSYVNLGMTASVNIQTRVLTVKVKGYFTANGAANNKINVALLQNKIEGPQTGGSSNNPTQVLPNGNYEHNHVLRHLVTGQWGEAVTTTTSGTTYDKTFTYTIPAHLNDVAYELGNLEVAAFITEGNQEIITGVSEDVTLDIPAGTQLVDFKSENVMADGADYCLTSITPKVKITNAGTNTINSYKASYSLNGGTKVYETVSTPLAAGASYTVEFSSVNFTDKVNEFNFDAESNVNTDVDVVLSNNKSKTSLYFNLGTIGAGHEEDFESADSPADLDNCVVTTSGLTTFVLSKDGVNGLTYDIGGFGLSEKSIFFHNYSSQAGTKAFVTYEKIDFSSGTNHGITFDHAYAQYDGTSNDLVKVKVSTDCGATWTTVKELKGASAKTAAPKNNGAFLPTETQWKKNILDLTSYTGQSDVMVQFEAVSDYGNSFLIDNIVIGANTPISVEENLENTFNVFPNPATDIINLSNSEFVNNVYTISDITGKTVLTGKVNSNLTINISSISTGSYTLDIDGKISKLVVR